MPYLILAILFPLLIFAGIRAEVLRNKYVKLGLLIHPPWNLSSATLRKAQFDPGNIPYQKELNTLCAAHRWYVFFSYLTVGTILYSIFYSFNNYFPGNIC